MYLNGKREKHNEESVEGKLRRYELLKAEADTVRKTDKIIIQNLFKNFFGKRPDIGIGFQRAYGSILAGDYFDLIPLPDKSFLFVFTDISGHGLPAYTTLIKLRAAITIAVNELSRVHLKHGLLDTGFLVKNIATKFTDIMESSYSDDFACVNFTFIRKEKSGYRLRFYNHSMLFPIIIKKHLTGDFKIINLNESAEGWTPERGFLLGRELRLLLKDDYLVTPGCDYYLNEGDSMLFFSDGIIESFNKNGNGGKDEFGEQRLLDILKENYFLHPQVVIDLIFETVYRFIGNPEEQKDDMTAVMINFPSVSE